MTVLATESSKLFHGSGNNGPFTWTWRFMANAEISVVKIVDETETLLTLGVDYAVAGAGSYSGGSIILTDVLGIGEDMRVDRIGEITQGVDLRNQRDFFAENYEEALDRITMRVQEIKRMVIDKIDAPRYGAAPLTILGFDSGGLPVYIPANVWYVSTGTVGAVTDVAADATIGPLTVVLPASGEVVIVKVDDSVNEITPIASIEGQEVNCGPLTIQGETVRLRCIAGNWYRA